MTAAQPQFALGSGARTPLGWRDPVRRFAGLAVAGVVTMVVALVATRALIGLFYAAVPSTAAACVAVSERMEAQARERAGAYLVVDDAREKGQVVARWIRANRSRRGLVGTFRDLVFGRKS